MRRAWKSKVSRPKQSKKPKKPKKQTRPTAAARLRERVRRRARALAAEAEEALADDAAPLTPERVHRLRVICKHLRATWQLLTPALGRGQTRPRERALRDAARVLAGSREAHVLGRTVIRLTRRHGDARLAGAGERGVLAPVDAMEQLMDVVHDRWPDHRPPPHATAALHAVFVAQGEAIERWPDAIDGDQLVAGIVRSYGKARQAGRRALRGAHGTPPASFAWPLQDEDPISAAEPVRDAAGETLVPAALAADEEKAATRALRTAAGEAARTRSAPGAAAARGASRAPPSDEAWHLCRRWVKYELYQLALLSRSARPGKRQRRLERFGERLGRFQDLCDLRALVAAAHERLEVAGALPGIEWVLALEEAPLRRQLRRSFQRLHHRAPDERSERLARRLLGHGGSA